MRVSIMERSRGAWLAIVLCVPILVGLVLVAVPDGGASSSITWATKAESLRGRDGQRFTFTCPPGGSPGRSWGTDVYTDDSSICTAAVHAGLISLAGGGTVTVEVRAGRSSYAGSSRHGVTTSSYGGWQGSFVFVAGAAASPSAAVPPATSPTPSPTTPRSPGIAASGTPISWVIKANDLRGRNGQRFTFVCPPGGSPSRTWGTDVYTDDSSICTAAVHAGLISFTTGGAVTIEIRPGQSAYTGTSRYGVGTSSYGAWPGSFVFVAGAAPPVATAPPQPALPSPASPPISAPAAPPVVSAPPPSGGTSIGWTANASALRGRNGQHFTLTCPPGGSPGRTWGTDIYTDDSSICTAAVHAGLVTFGGGTVIIEIRPGQSSYAGTSRHGVGTSSYGAWQGSFVFVAGAAPPGAAPSAPPVVGAPSGGALPSGAGAAGVLFDNWNKATVANGPLVPTTFTLHQPTLITRIVNYHWNSGRGAPPGMIGMRTSDGTVYGPWQTRGTSGTFGAQNVNWIAEPNEVLPAGTYTVLDSDQATWSHNSGSGHRGFTSVTGGPAQR